MFTTQIMSLLADRGIIPDNVHELTTAADEWFDAEPNLSTFTLRSIFRELSQEWDDPQGIPTAVYQPFAERLLPVLRRVASQNPAASRESISDDLTELVKTFQSCLAATRT